jgi:spore photoproduct lyase
MTFLYVEKNLLNHPRALTIQKKMKATLIPIDHYGEIFNRHGSHYRLQKKQPSLILAQKQGKLVYEISSNFGIGNNKNYYFSYVLNCPFDCNYCYLQGRHRSAHPILFLNFEDFEKALLEKIGKEKITFFSGYDGDSLALEPLSGFLDYFLPFFEKHPTATLELRTKSVNIQKLLKFPPFPNCVIAFTLSPEKISHIYEKKAPSLKRRFNAIALLQKKGWNIGLRFDPIIYVKNYQEHYQTLFHEALSLVKKPHSITLGTFRLPLSLFKEMKRVKPQEKLLALCQEREGQMTLPKEEEMLAFCRSLLPKEKVFVCH